MFANRSTWTQPTTGRWLWAISLVLLLGVGWVIWRSFHPPRIDKRVQNYAEIRIAHSETGECVVWKPPFHIVDCRVEEALNGTRLILSLESLNPELITRIDQSVYAIGIHTNTHLIVYAHNTNALRFRSPAFPKNDTLFVMDKRYRIVAQGQFLPEYDQKRITIKVPLRLLPRDVALVRFRYLPSTKQARQMPKDASPLEYFPAVSTIRFSHPKERRYREQSLP